MKFLIDNYTSIQKEWPEAKILYEIKISIDAKLVKLIISLYFPKDIFKVLQKVWEC